MFSAIHPTTDKLTNTSIADQVKQAINAGTSVVTGHPSTAVAGHTSTVPPPSKPSKLKKSLGLDVTMNNLSMIDRQGPATAQLHSPFLSSPVIASTLLMSAGKIAKDHRPAAGAPSSPLVRHPIALPSMQQMMSVGIDVNQSQVMFEGQVRPVAVSAFEDLLFLMRIAKWKVAYHDGLPFERQEQLPYFGRFDEKMVTETFTKLIDDIWPSKDGVRSKEAIRASELAGIIITPATPLQEVVGALGKAFELFGKSIARFGGSNYTSFNTDGDAPSAFTLTTKHNPDRLVIEWPQSLGGTLLTAIQNAAQKLRDNETDPNFVDYLVFHVGYELLRSGANVDQKDARWLGTSGFRRDTQTYVSLTDPGDGHVTGTTRKERWMRGAIVHVEHLERPGNLAREEVESYRIPSIFEFARVRLHTGSSAPNTYFVGRRVKDSTSGRFDLDFIKIVNLTSAACSAAFQLGAAETKVAMDTLTASEAIAYMRALSGHVLRNHKQILSAAFNLNTPLVDDLAEADAEGNYPVITDNIEIGRRGIELAALGGFDKVTFDGAADTYPSECIVLQLCFENALELIHLAHQAGLLTYMSAGFKFGGHIPQAVFAGTDGIGIGGAQILRYMDHSTGHQGPYTEEFIDRIDKERDEAANSIRGRGVHLLCRLDRMYYEGTITQAEEDLREPLFQALGAIDEPLIESFLNHQTLAHIISIPDDGETPTLGQARRLLRAQGPLIRAKLTEENTGKWDKFTKDLAGLVKSGDEEIMTHFYKSHPWNCFRADYAKSLATVRQDRMYTVKATPHAPKSYA